MTSKVSRRLKEDAAPEVCEHVYAPRLARDFPAVFEALCDLNQAHLLMLRGCGLLEEADARQLAAALLHIEQAGAGSVRLDPALEDAYFNFEAELMRVAGVHVGGCLHVARSRNDILATLDRLRAREAGLHLVDRIAAAEVTALQGALRHAGVVMPGYTHLQPAQPVTFGWWLLGVARMLARDVARLQRLEPEFDRSPLGAGALAGTSFAIDRGATASWLGFSGIVPHALDAVASRDFALDLLAACAVMAVGASRVAQDLHVWCTPEFGLVDFPDSVTGTSSIMPQKKNPIVLEFLKGRAGHINGALSAALGTVRGIHFTHNGEGSREAMRHVWEATGEAQRVAVLLELVLRTAEPLEGRMLQRAREDFGTATDLADALVRTCGLSFRESHHVVGAVVRAALDAGRTAGDITAAMVEAAARDTLGRALAVPDGIVRASLDPLESVRARRVPGGTAPEGVRADAQALLAEAEQARAANAARRAGFAARRHALKASVAALAGGAATVP